MLKVLLAVKVHSQQCQVLGGGESTWWWCPAANTTLTYRGIPYHFIFSISSRVTKYKHDFRKMVKVNLENYTTSGYHTSKYAAHTSVLFQIHVNEQLPNKLMTYNSIIYITARQKLHLDVSKLYFCHTNQHQKSA